jgi:hypothetical protein
LDRVELSERASRAINLLLCRTLTLNQPEKQLSNGADGVRVGSGERLVYAFKKPFGSAKPSDRFALNFFIFWKWLSGLFCLRRYYANRH